MLSPALSSPGDIQSAQLRLAVPAAQSAQVAGQARDRLADAGVRATVKAEGRERDLIVAALGAADPATVDRARTALDGLVPGHVATTEQDEDHSGGVLLADVGTGTVVVLSVSFLVAIALGTMNLTGLTTLLICVVVGFAGVIGAGALSKPLLRSVTADPAPRPD